MAASNITLFFKLKSNLTDPNLPCEAGAASQATFYFEGSATDISQLISGNIQLFTDESLEMPFSEDAWFSETDFPSQTQSVTVHEYSSRGPGFWTGISDVCQSTGGDGRVGGGGVDGFTSANIWYKGPVDDNPCEEGRSEQLTIYWANPELTTLAQVVSAQEPIFISEGGIAPTGWYGDAEFPGSTNANIYYWDKDSGKWLDAKICTGTGGENRFFTLNLLTGETTVCRPDDELVIGEYYYYADSPKSIPELIASNIPIFRDPGSAQNWGLGLNSTLDGAAGPGFYREPGQLNFGYWTGFEWFPDRSGTCDPIPEIELYFIDLLEISNSNDPTSILAYCCQEPKPIRLYYAALQDYGADLIALVNDRINLYTDERFAEDGGTKGLAQPSVYNADPSNETEKLLILDERNIWFGADDNGNLVKAGKELINGVETGLIKNYLSCPERPAIDPTVTITSSNPFANRVFYAFFACEPDDKNRFKMYIVDGQHFNGVENFMSQFIDRLNEGNLYTISSKLENTVGCVTYAHKIIALNIDEASSLLGNQSVNYETIVQSDLVDLGIGNNSSLFLYSDCCDCVNQIDGKEYTFNDIGIEEPEDLGPNFNIESNAKLDNVAKPLLRTNPKLTTNVKLVTNSKDEIYLESINATDALASAKYKKFSVSPDGSYAYDLSRFYRENKTPLEIAFTTKRNDSDFSVFSEYEKQIEEDYQYGTTLNYSKLHDEEFRMLAPIYVDLNMPKKFVIYRINDPRYRDDYENTALDNFTRTQLMLRNSEIVKVFDLSKESNIGKYLRNYTQDQAFPKAPITFSFEENEKSTFNGIDLVKGGFTSKGEYLYNDYILKDKPMISANDFITDGFRRNSLAAANVINMEFLFDDPKSDVYSVNRYVGLYVDDIPTGLGKIYSANSGLIRFESVTSYMDSIYDFAAIPSAKMLQRMPVLAYATIGGNYYKIDNSKNYDHSKYELDVVDPKNEINGQTGIAYKGESIDIETNNQRGFDFIKIKIKDIPGINDNIALVKIKRESYRFDFIKFVQGADIIITDTEGDSVTFNTASDITSALSNLETAFLTSSMASIYNLETNVSDKSFTITEKDANLINLSPSITQADGCVIRTDEIYSNVEIENNRYYAASTDPLDNSYLPKGTFKGNSFSAAGNTTDIAIALTKLINSKGLFSATNISDEIYISIKIPGYKILQHTLLYFKNNNIDFIEFDAGNLDQDNELGLSSSAAGNSGTWDAYLFKGGHLSNKSVYVNNETLPIISIGDYLPTVYRGRYNRIIDIVENTEDPTGNFSKIILKDENTITSGEVRLFAEPSLEMGLFSAYNLYDMDFDFYDTSNSDLKELRYETQESIGYTPYDDVKFSVENDPNYSGIEPNEVLAEDYEEQPEDYFANLQPVLKNETTEDEDQESITSEYDRLKENEIKEFAVGSRVVPNINKWVLKDGTTVREEPYHLNANSAFGRTNFAPDLEVEGRDKKAFTHEWFYIEEIPDYLRFWQINESFNYVNFIKGYSINKSDFKRVDRDYFNVFMVGDGHEVENYTQNPLSTDSILFDSNSFIKSNIKKKYTLVDNGSSETFAHTIFKGLKVIFKERKEFANDIASEFVKTSAFNGYRFSTMVKVNTDVVNNTIDYEVIRNKKFKFVIFFITLNIAEPWTETLNRKLFYELKHRLDYNIALEEYQYSDINLSGALDLISVNFNGRGPYSVKGITASDGSEPNFILEVSKNEGGTFNKIEIDLGNIGTYEFEISSVESSNEIFITNKPTLVGNSNIVLDTVGLNMSDLRNATYTYIKGGFNAHEAILNKLSANTVAEILAKNDDQVKYTTIDVDGTVLDKRFVINFDDGKEIIKKVDLTTTEDIDKPKSYTLLNTSTVSKLSDNFIANYDKLKKIIGYKIVPAPEYFEFMVRHSGNYTIDLEPVVTFTDIYTHYKSNRNHQTLDPFEVVFEEELYKHSLASSIERNIAKSYYHKFNRCGVAFNVGFIKDSNVLDTLQGVNVLPVSGNHDAEWSLIKNHHYHKVNEINPNGVIKLSQGGDFLPLYPLINEIAIDKKDINVFRSSWESNYYTRSLAGGRSISIAGTFDTAEEKSYLGSTAMNIKDAYFLTKFSTQRAESEEVLDEILRTGNNDADVVIFEDKQNLIADFYLDEVVYLELSEAGALNTLTRFIDPRLSIGDKTSLNDDMRSYVEKNLLPVFTIDQIDLFVRRFKGRSSEILSSANIDALDDGGFTRDQTFTYRLHGNTPLNFRLIYNKRLGYSYDIRPMIKIQS